MTFFSGFSLQGEAELFDAYLAPWRDNPYVVAGFSYGAIRAFEHVLASAGRIDRLLLLSPAWFVNKKSAFKRVQLAAFEKSPEAYLERFFENALEPAPFDVTKYRKTGTLRQLEELLHYPWEEAKLEALVKRGVKVEVFLGARDRIVDAPEAHRFFRRYATSWLFKPYGHFLR